MKLLRIFIVLAMAAFVLVYIQYRTASSEKMVAEASPQARLLLALYETNTGVVEVDPQSHNIVYANDAACVIFGFENEQLVGHHLNELLPDWMQASHSIAMDTVRDSLSKDSHKGRVLATRCVAARRDKGEVVVVVRVFASRHGGMFALVNLGTDTLYVDNVPFRPESAKSQGKEGLAPKPSPGQ